jgi:protein-tyrosine phosphatase
VAVILVVCTGNTCRSPMTMALLRHQLDGTDRAEIVVESAGTLGWNGRPATDHTVEVLGEMGVDLSGHVSRRIDHAMLASSDLVLAMTRNHSWAVAAHDPEMMHRTFLLGEIVRLGEVVGARGDETLREWIERVDARRTEHKRIGRADEEIPDPLGEPLDTYRHTAERVQRSVNRLAKLL